MGHGDLFRALWTNLTTGNRLDSFQGICRIVAIPTLVTDPDHDVFQDPQEDHGLCYASVVSPRGNVIFHADDAGMRINEITGKDLNGDGQPDAVFEGYSGGAHCCWTYWIISLGEWPGLIKRIENERPADFKDIDNDGRIEIWTGDGAFDYFDCLSHAATPFPDVIFRLEGRALKDVSYEFRHLYDREIMEARAELTAVELDRFRAVKDVCDDQSVQFEYVIETMPKVLRIVYAYLYGSREQTAWQALEEMWPAHDVHRIRKQIIETRGRGILKHVHPQN